VSKDPVFLCLVTTGRIHKIFPRLHIIQSAGANLSGNTVVVQLSNPRYKVALLPEQLRQGDSVRQELSEVRRWPVVGGKLPSSWI
jgi:hypothetical protein